MESLLLSIKEEVVKAAFDMCYRERVLTAPQLSNVGSKCFHAISIADYAISITFPIDYKRIINKR